MLKKFIIFFILVIILGIGVFFASEKRNTTVNENLTNQLTLDHRKING